MSANRDADHTEEGEGDGAYRAAIQRARERYADAREEPESLLSSDDAREEIGDRSSE